MKIIKDLRATNFLFLLLAGIINATGVALLLIPAQLYDGGFSGTSFLLSQHTPLPISVYLLILNIPIFIIGYKKLGGNFIVYSLFAISVYSGMTYLYQFCFYLNFQDGSPFGINDLILSAVFGGLISGIGSGLTIRFGGAMDGIEVLAVLYSKKLNITIGTFVMIYNCILYIAAGLIFKTWTIPLYSIIAYACGLKAVDYVVDGFDKSKSVFIISEYFNEIADALSEEFKRGITILDAIGHYSKSDKKMIYCVIHRFEVSKLKSVINRIDENAFVAINEVSETMSSNLKFNRFSKPKNKA